MNRTGLSIIHPSSYVMIWWGGVVGKGCSRYEDGVGGGLGKCVGHDEIFLTGFFMEYFSHRRYQKMKKLLGGINMV